MIFFITEYNPWLCLQIRVGVVDLTPPLPYIYPDPTKIKNQLFVKKKNVNSNYGLSRLHFSQFHYKQIAICKQGDIFVDRQHETVAWLATEANKHFNVE